MFTHTPHPAPRGALRRILQVALLAMALPMATGTSTLPTVAGFSMDGADAKHPESRKPVIEAAFPRESYRPGASARLVIFSREAKNVSVQVFRAGTENEPIEPRDEMYVDRGHGPQASRHGAQGTGDSGSNSGFSERPVLRQALRLGPAGRLCAVRPSTTASR